MAIISREVRAIAEDRLKEMGFCVTYGRNVEERDMLDSSSVSSRLEDLHRAFADENVKAIFTAIGGFNINQLLPSIDYDLIGRHPKILCGYSDITALANVVMAKTGLVTYSGPHFSTFGMSKGLEYTVDMFRRCLMQDGPLHVTPSDTWSDDAWYEEQQQRTFRRNDGYLVIQEGEAEGTIIGGNLCTFGLLRGTAYMPELKDTLLFIEDDNGYTGDGFTVEFDRNLQALIHQPGFSGVRGVVIGRCESSARMTEERLRYVIETKEELRGIPVIAGVDFGHTTPHITFPIGGRAKIVAKKSDAAIEILMH